MDEERKFSYKFTGEISDVSSLKEKLENIEGITSVTVSESDKEISYSLNEWASEYDAFTAVMSAVEEFGAEIDLNEEEELAPGTESDIATEESEEEEEKADLKKEKKFDFIEKISVLSISVVLFIVGLFLDSGNAKMWVFMFSFIFAAYETLFSVINKVVEKKYCFEEFIVLLPTLAMLYLGKHSTGALIMILYSLSAFLRGILCGKIQADIGRIKNGENASGNEVSFYENIFSSLLPEERFFEINKFKIHLGFVIAGIFIAFIPPLFEISRYGYLLVNKWLFIGASVMIFGNFSAFSVFFKFAYYYVCKLLFKCGIKIKDLAVLREIADAEEVVFDGATVLGEDFEVLSVDAKIDEFQSIVGLSLRQSKSPIFIKLAEHFKGDSVDVSSFKEIEDKGILCEVGGKIVAIGNKKLLADLKIETEDTADGSTPLFVAYGGELIGVIKLRFFIGNNAYGAIKEINEDLKVKTTLLSSDGLSAVNSTKKELGFSKAVSSCTKEYKISYLNKGKALYFGSCTANGEVLSKSDLSVSLGGEHENSVADISDKDLKNAPRLLKTAIRTVGLISRGEIVMLISKILGLTLSAVLFAISSLNLTGAFFALDLIVQSVYLFVAKSNSRDTI